MTFYRSAPTRVFLRKHLLLLMKDLDAIKCVSFLHAFILSWFNVVELLSLADGSGVAT